jgi:hypothetical protein
MAVFCLPLVRARFLLGFMHFGIGCVGLLSQKTFKNKNKNKEFVMS